MIPFRSSLAPLAVAASLAAAGCGGGSTPPHRASATLAAPAAPARSGAPTSSTAGAPLSRAQYVARGNALCKREHALSPAFPGTKSGNGLATVRSLIVPYLTTVQSLASNTLDGFRALHPPDALRARADQLLVDQQARIRDVGQALNAAQANDGPTFTAAFQQDQQHDGPRYYRAAAALGVMTCARAA